MKKIGRFVALIVVCGLMAAAPWAMKTAVVDVRERIKPPYEGWEGVITVGHVPTFPLTGAERVLKERFAAFEAQQEHVMVSVREMTKAGVQAAAAAQAMPDILVCGIGVFDEGERKEMRCGEEMEIMRGKYALMGNRRMLEEVGWEEKMEMSEVLRLAAEKGMKIAVPKREYSSPGEALRRMGAGEGIEIVEDIYARVWPDFVLEEKYPLYVATEREVKRMEVLRSAGRGFETVVIKTEESVGEDLKLVGMGVKAELTVRKDDEECAGWVEAVIEAMMSDAPDEE